MNEKKQIEEMAQDMYDLLPDYEHNFLDCRRAAEEMFARGYRKPTEWISVDERLPEQEGWYLVYTAPDKKHKSINKAEFCNGFEWNNFEPYWRGAGGHWGNVTHWMPLPEPPKEKETPKNEKS